MLKLFLKSELDFNYDNLQINRTILLKENLDEHKFMKNLLQYKDDNNKKLFPE